MNTQRVSPAITTLVFLILVLLLTILPVEEKSADNVTKGLLDLTGDNRSLVSLSGEWEYYRNKFVFTTQEDPGYITLPHTWKDNRYGYASYRMVIKGLVPGKDYGLKIPYMSTAYILYMDGLELARNGNIGTDRESSEPAYLPLLVSITPHENTVEFILQVSNFHHRRGGAFQTILFGTEDAIRHFDFWNLSADLAFLSVFLMMGIFQLSLFFIRKDKAPLYLGLFFISTSLTGLFGTPEALIFRAYHALDWTLFQKLCYLVTYFVPLWIITFIYSLYGEIPEKYLPYIFTPFLFIYLVILVTPTWIFTQLNPIFQVYSFIIYAIALGILIKAIVRKRKWALILSLAYMIFCASALSATFYSNNRIHSGALLPLSFLTSFFFQDQLQSSHLPLDTISYILILAFINIFSLFLLVKNPQLMKRRINGADTNTVEKIKNKAKTVGLSKRELEISLLVLRGKSNREISDELYISLSTVKTHISRIFRKAEVKSRNEFFFFFQDPSLTQ